MKLGFEKSKEDPMLYLKKEDENFIFLVVYMDDLLILANALTLVVNIIQEFKRPFEIREWRTIDKLFEMTLEDNGDEIKIHNQPTVKWIFQISRWNNASQKICHYLLDWIGPTTEILDDANPYWQLIGALTPLENTVKPDLCYLVNYLPRLMHKPTPLL